MTEKATNKVKRTFVKNGTRSKTELDRRDDDDDDDDDDNDDIDCLKEN